MISPLTNLSVGDVRTMFLIGLYSISVLVVLIACSSFNDEYSKFSCSSAIDRSKCMSHGSCIWCHNNGVGICYSTEKIGLYDKGYCYY